MDTSFLIRTFNGEKEFPPGAKAPSSVYVIYPFENKHAGDLLPNERIGLLHTDLTKLFGTDLKKYADKFVIRQPVTVQNKKYYNLHRLLRCIDKNVLLSRLPVANQCSPDEIFLAPIRTPW